MVVRTNLGTWSKLQGHLQLHTLFEVILDYGKYYLKIKANKNSNK